MKILDIERIPKEAQKNSPEARAVQTTGIVAQCGKDSIVLFMAGQKHGGENLGELLAR